MMKRHFSPQSIYSHLRFASEESSILALPRYLLRVDAELTSSYAVGKLSNCAPHNVAHDAITQTVTQRKAFMIFNLRGPSCDETPCRRAKEEESNYVVQ